jgi:hypothetical protein
MSDQNVARARQAHDALNDRDLDALLAVMDEDVEAVSRIAAVEGGFRGHEGLRAWWANLFDTWPDLTALVEVRALADDLTLSEVSLRGHGAGSDIPWEWKVWQAARWRNGKCVWWMSCSTAEGALAAAGLEHG